MENRLQILGYKPATLKHNTNGWYIEYHVYSPVSNKSERIRTKLNVVRDGYKRLNDFRAHADKMVQDILIFYSLIRPKEIGLIQIRDINLEEGYIVIPEDKAKTHIERYAPLSMELIERLKEMHLERYPKDYYLLGSEYVPSEKPAYTGKYKKDWMKIREDLHLPQEMQLYSFKDDGITGMVDDCNVNVHTVQGAAGHQDVTTTMKYVRKIDLDMIKKIQNCGISFHPTAHNGEDEEDDE